MELYSKKRQDTDGSCPGHTAQNIGAIIGPLNILKNDYDGHKLEAARKQLKG